MHCARVNRVIKGRSIPIYAIYFLRLNRLTIYIFILITNLLDHLQVHLLVSKAQHFNVGKRVRTLARITFAVGNRKSSAVLVAGNGVTVGIARIFRHVNAVSTVWIPILGVCLPVSAAIQGVISFVTAQGITTGTTHQGVVSISAV